MGAGREKRAHGGEPGAVGSASRGPTVPTAASPQRACQGHRRGRPPPGRSDLLDVEKGRTVSGAGVVAPPDHTRLRRPTFVDREVSASLAWVLETRSLIATPRWEDHHAALTAYTCLRRTGRGCFQRWSDPVGAPPAAGRHGQPFAPEGDFGPTRNHNGLLDGRTTFDERAASLFDEGLRECLSLTLPLDKRFHTCEGRFSLATPATTVPDTCTPQAVMRGL